MLARNGEAEINAVEALAIDQAADADRFACRLQIDPVEPVAVSCVHRSQAVFDVGLRIFDRTYAKVANVLVPHGVVDEIEDELGVARVQFVKGEAF